MRKFMYSIAATAALLLVGQSSAQADWVPKVNPFTGLIDYWFDPTDDPDPDPPHPGFWFKLRLYEGWIAIQLG